MLTELTEKMVNELAYGEFVRKQKSINRLQPQFPGRVDTVKKLGGVRMSSARPGLWQFRIKSASMENHWYDAYLKFRGLENSVKKHAKDVRLWKKDKSGVDLRKLAVEVLFGTDLETKCSCPADLYFGGHYIRTGRKAKYTEPERRPPVVRNPKQYGLFCKHLQVLFDVLPMYAGTMASHLSKFYSDAIETAEEEVRKERKDFRAAAELLRKKLEPEKPEEEPEKEEPEEPKEPEKEEPEEEEEKDE